MIALILLFSILGLTAIAAYRDILTYTIPNWISLFLLGLFPFFVLASGMDLKTLGLHVLVGAGALLITMLMFGLRIIGGGDAKLFSVLALWFGWSDIGSYLFWVSISGFFLAVFLIIMRRIPALSRRYKQEWVQKLLKKKQPAPYGIALGIGTYIALPLSSLFQSLVSQGIF